MDGPDDLAAGFRNYANTQRDLLDEIPAIRDRGVEATVRDAFGDSQRYVPVDTGHLKQTGEVRKLRTARWELRYTADYAAAVERGHSGYTVRPMDADALRFEIDGAVVFAQKADIPARDGVWYLKRAVEENRQALGRNIGAEFRHVANRLYR